MCVCVHSCSSWENMLESRNPDNWGNRDLLSFSPHSCLLSLRRGRRKRKLQQSRY